MTKIAAILFVAACASAQQPQPVGYAEHMHAAETHEAKAMQLDKKARITEAPVRTYNCGDTVLADQTTVGGERLELATPCFDATEETAVHEHWAAEHERNEAKRDRQAAANLVETELHSCQGIPERERQHSPFAHKSSIASVEAYREGGKLRGVRISFKPVRGLTAEWLERDIQCQQARYATLGQPADYLPRDPTLVPNAHVGVSDVDHHIEVLVIAPDGDSGQLAFQRAQDLLAPAAAAR
jgi:hypothetical protein